MLTLLAFLPNSQQRPSRLYSLKSFIGSMTDSQTKVLNRVLEIYLRCLVVEEPKYWSKFLRLEEYWYDTTHHTSNGMSLFRAMYGLNPQSIVHYLSDGIDIATRVGNFNPNPENPPRTRPA
ncbi:hypothetical protein Sango_1554600 [Sesamum angolense]|uniref:Uncharacterized protein n=1 Tax=Sesamum angolense TaxID=2727404 RepID=A0AAE1WPL5_9LAMI|nr:hypothetical protein Sango_1554600 [Sesamum angolense]